MIHNKKEHINIYNENLQLLKDLKLGIYYITVNRITNDYMIIEKYSLDDEYGYNMMSSDKAFNEEELLMVNLIDFTTIENIETLKLY